ncbi:MAG: translation initiation factor IF-2 N-terminal domain-containing protein [Desulfobacterales bacterium]|nr:translation initiation factor IF-2 N-terminal domain-containing protein [Desulfobacterales bacterium]
MAKLRVYELARELNMDNKTLLDKMQEMHIDAKSHMTALDDDTISRIKSAGSKKAFSGPRKRKPLLKTNAFYPT